MNLNARIGQHFLESETHDGVLMSSAYVHQVTLDAAVFDSFEYSLGGCFVSVFVHESCLLYIHGCDAAGLSGHDFDVSSAFGTGHHGNFVRCVISGFQ